MDSWDENHSGAWRLITGWLTGHCPTEGDSLVEEMTPVSESMWTLRNIRKPPGEGIRSDCPEALRTQLLSPSPAALCKWEDECRQRLSHFPAGTSPPCHKLCVVRQKCRCRTVGGMLVKWTHNWYSLPSWAANVMQKWFVAQKGKWSIIDCFSWDVLHSGTDYSLQVWWAWNSSLIFHWCFQWPSRGMKVQLHLQ